MVLIFILLIIFLVFYSGLFRKEETTPEPLVKLYLSQQDQVIELKLEEYLAGTVAAEMPASFGLEALKAQAVCARTYAVRKIVTGRTYPRGADLSDDITCCQAYRTEKIAPALQAKIMQAVSETRGEIMLYRHEPIDALYHSTCGGQTESASNAWIKGCPYLKSVKCKYCTNSSHYSSQVTFSAQQIAARFGLSPGRELKVQILERTSSGRVKKLQINDQSISGESFRHKLGLPSTWFSIEWQDHNLVITNRGYGHGVGMCQYGAGGMAQAGKNYREILEHYYQQVEFYKIQY